MYSGVQYSDALSNIVTINSSQLKFCWILECGYAGIFSLTYKTRTSILATDISIKAEVELIIN